MDQYTFRHLRGWSRQTRYFARAWVVLMNGDRDLITANSLLRLNRLAKQDYAIRSTYDMKNHLVKIFYQKGYCIRAVKSEQTLPCWHTQRYLNGWTDYCPKCQNTGIYARHELFRFTFLIGGQHYVWHQPARLVDWEVKINGEPVVYEGREPGETKLTKEQRYLDQAILYVYLRMAGVPNEKITQPPIRGLGWALRWDWDQLWKDGKWKVKRWVRGWRKKPEAVRVWSDDDIPF